MVTGPGGYLIKVNVKECRANKFYCGAISTGRDLKKNLVRRPGH
jgi:hypothetical protein